MPDDKGKLCPNCKGSIEETAEGLYCSACDLTFSPAKGRVKADAGGKGRLQQIEEEIMIMKDEQDKIKSTLFGKNEPFWMR